MSKFFNNELRDLPLQEIKDTANALVLLKAYSYGDNYNTVYVTNNIGEVATDPADYVLEDGDTGRVLVVSAQLLENASASGPDPDMHVAVVDTVSSRVLAVTKENYLTEVFEGNLIELPAFNILLPQST